MIDVPSYEGPADYTPSLPCCRDRFGEQSCQALRKAQPAMFEKRVCHSFLLRCMITYVGYAAQCSRAVRRQITPVD
ncbi:hypothetical protein ANCDUO_05636 [Ancylostoma duodenale]|uniref:Uncharacterized protein n=1 Tax=Ancylostoma duodenale TaxID=51022 RepID=A0A0C2H3P9_9BILA|nr:hypothetical protein ANCDUO_05636 [Ancylostoma duodenale]